MSVNAVASSTTSSLARRVGRFIIAPHPNKEAKLVFPILAGISTSAFTRTALGMGLKGIGVLFRISDIPNKPEFVELRKTTMRRESMVLAMVGVFSIANEMVLKTLKRLMPHHKTALKALKKHSVLSLIPQVLSIVMAEYASRLIWPVDKAYQSMTPEAKALALTPTFSARLRHNTPFAGTYSGHVPPFM